MFAHWFISVYTCVFTHIILSLNMLMIYLLFALFSSNVLAYMYHCTPFSYRWYRFWHTIYFIVVIPLIIMQLIWYIILHGIAHRKLYLDPKNIPVSSFNIFFGNGLVFCVSFIFCATGSPLIQIIRFRQIQFCFIQSTYKWSYQIPRPLHWWYSVSIRP